MRFFGTFFGTCAVCNGHQVLFGTRHQVTHYGDGGGRGFGDRASTSTSSNHVVPCPSCFGSPAEGSKKTVRHICPECSGSGDSTASNDYGEPYSCSGCRKREGKLETTFIFKKGKWEWLSNSTYARLHR
jgi:hypothetical protein